jgi:hypothetical protein
MRGFFLAAFFLQVFLQNPFQVKRPFIILAPIRVDTIFFVPQELPLPSPTKLQDLFAQLTFN